MALEHKLVQKLSQSLLMTPQLQQAIKLLQMGRLEYKEAIEKELLENPVLEEIKEEEDGRNGASENGSSPAETPIAQPGDNGSEGDKDNPDSPQARADWEDYLDSYTDSRGSATPKGLHNFEERPSVEAAAAKTENLYEHLLSQARFLDLPEDELVIAQQIVGNLNKDGYLCSSHEEIAETCKCGLSTVTKVVDLIKSLDPPGIGARDLSECLLMQLEQLGLADGLAARIVQNHLEKLERRKYDLIAKAEHVAVEEVYKAVTAIQALEPRPGRAFYDDAVRYIVPDIYVYKVGGEYVITQNEEGLPRLRVNSYYLDLLKSTDDENSPNRNYLNERLKAASWLIKSIHQRQHTIYKVTESIVKHQRDFLDFGISKLRPLVLKDVADDIGMHESTVSRVTTNKYVHTPQGVFELKFFFTTGIKTADGDVSSCSIKERIKEIIAAEAPNSPISDQDIVDTLAKENIKLARRTVAKYRESLGILSSSRRKKPF